MKMQNNLAPLSFKVAFKRPSEIPFKRPAIIFSFCCMFLLGLPGCKQEDPPPRQPNVLLIVVDTLRPDRLGSYGHNRNTSPAMDGLAENAIRFERAYSTAPWTMPSVASMMTGLYPSTHGLTKTFRPLRKELPTLTEILKGNGYRTSGVVSHSLLSRQFNFDQGFESFSMQQGGHDFLTTSRVTNDAVAELQKFSSEGTEKPFFLFAHYFDPHYSWLPHPDYGFAAPSVGRLEGGEDIGALMGMRHELSEYEISFLRDLYDGEVRHTDQGIQRLLTVLAELGFEEDTLIILAGDHGEEFMEHGWLGHTASLYETLIHVPLIIKPPRYDGPPRIIQGPVSLVSLTPTVLDLLDLNTELYEFQGRSLRPEIETGKGIENELIFAEVNYEQHSFMLARKNAVIAYPFKLIVDGRGGETELYDISTDPGEEQNLISEQPEIAAKLEEALYQFSEHPGEPDSVLSEELRNSLRALGYVE